MCRHLRKSVLNAVYIFLNKIAGTKNEIKYWLTKKFVMETKTAEKPKRRTRKEQKSNGTLKSQAKKKEAEKDLSKTYNEFKEFEGQHYTGMRVGRSHKWHYDKGEWKERKITPDLWEISYAVTKRRAGHAPEGSGVPLGTEYHWYILAHQNVRKLNANNYTTSMTGLKYKLAHKRADKDKWSASAKAQRKRLVKLLQELIAQLEQEPVSLEIEYDGKNIRVKQCLYRKLVMMVYVMNWILF